ncbi:glycosyltransferase family 2 protein [Desertibacillus haloalkaliphilus]|uniref:glycosyltransferase family 2 protein n=1 Tax=Desertibacillus haloalkaliphilus TaxID=1328930 RepID=UPI001C2812B2|nr:glycosyltransferase family 2 protein [Desertibacillus haloalkaliphilus]MBU8905914.1 glycosyltransferase family 2 protein [Desertibacillus haloalkaliphilus]
MNNIVVALPAYNEETGLPKLLDKIIAVQASVERPFEVIVVDDGSTDRTGEILKDYEQRYPFMTVITHRKNKGLGEAMKTIFHFLLDRYDDKDILITLDADNTHHPKIIPALVEKIEAEQLDLVVASRFTRGGKEMGLSPLRKVYSRGARLFFKMFFPISGVYDYSSGFRAYRLGAVRQAFARYEGKMITSNGFDCMVEILARFSKLDIKAGEYPLVLEYHLKETPSKMKVIRTITGYFSLLRRVKKPVGLSDEREVYE